MTNKIEISEGLQIHYVDIGKGDPIVLIPGWTCTTEFFEHNLTILAEQHRVIAYDPRSQGQSSTTEFGNNYTQRGDYLAAFIKTLELKNVILAGWSLGGFDAYAYLTKYGTDNIKVFICIDMPPKGIKTAENDWAEGSLGNAWPVFCNHAARSAWAYAGLCTVYDHT